MEIKKQYVVNERNQKVAVQIDIDTFEKIEELLENYALVQKMKEAAEGESLSLQATKNIGNGISANQIDLIVYDFDGVMTDNKVIVLQDGTEGIVANRGDGLGIGMLKKKGIPQIIISTEANPVVESRAKKLKLPVWYDAKDKKSILQDYCSQNGISLSRVVYVGNDINDLEVMKIVGYPIATADAHPSVRQIAKLLLASRGGDGAIRELADTILEREVT